VIILGITPTYLAQSAEDDDLLNLKF